MEVRTYSRGRAAVAAAKKALAHLEAFIVDVSAADHGDKFIAVVSIKAAGGKEIADAVKAAGFAVELIGASAPIPDPDLAPTATDGEQVDDQPQVSGKKSGGYIHEASGFKGACAMVHEIAAAMHRENPAVKKGDVIAACRRAGIAYGTARTQYQKWRSAKNKG